MGNILTRRSAASAALGAAVATAVVVTVYEGRVALATSHGTTEIGPGETAWAQRDGTPSHAVDVARAPTKAGPGSGAGDDNAALDEASLPAPALRERLAEVRAQRERQSAEIDALRARVRALESSTDAGPDSTQRLRSSSWYPPTPEDLDVLVEQCGIRADVPPILGLEPGGVGDAAEGMGMSEQEVAVVDEAIRRLHQRFLARLRSLYLEATGDEAGAQTLAPDAMLAQIYAAAMEGEVREAHRQVALELAGRAEPPASVGDLPPAVQAVRLHAGLGDELQRLLAAELGADRAHDLRAAQGGWPWGRSYSRTCH